ncbi:uncharacterized protein LOC141612443 [Silene latifolia]|uniref:uncharacterized protein LOC141612443 n=1 Tax=Silene latifolia TaxID=37657 RepID=UPI003D77C729
METSSEEIKGEASSKSLKSVNAWLRFQNTKKILKRKKMNLLSNLNLDHHHNHLDLTNDLSTWSNRRRMRCIQRRLPVDDYFHRLSVMNSINKDIPGTTLCSKCGAVFCPTNGNLCNSCLTCLNIQEDSVDGIPSSLAVKYCQGCQSYSFTGRANFVPASTLSTALLNFLLRRIDIHLYRLHLSLLGASFLPTGPNPSNIKIALLLQEDAVDGLNLMKRHIINYIVAPQTCYSCSSQKPASQFTNVVQFRRCDSDKRTIGRFMLKIGSHRTHRREVALKKMELVKKGLDFYFDTIDGAITYFNFLCTRLPIKPDKLQISPSNKDYIIPALVCPIGHEDLVYIRSNKVLVDLGFSGPLVICTKVTNCISLLDPLKLIERTITADEYWNEPNAFDLYKNVWDLVEYVVLDVQIISKEDEYSLADVLVAQSEDFGRSDIAFTTRTHLGHILKIGDYAFGYDLYSRNNSNTGNMDEQRESLPDVILVKKRGERMRPQVRRKNTSPEYEEFLRELDNNPEAMFNLSLNGESKDMNKQPVKDGEDSDFDLGGLLADLALGDKQDTDTPGRSDEQHR